MLARFGLLREKRKKLINKGGNNIIYSGKIDGDYSVVLYGFVWLSD
jgi:hypothetical protein